MDLTSPDDPLDDLLDEFPVAVAALAETARAAPPAGLRARTLEAALAARPPGRPAAVVEPVTPPEAFAESVADMVALLGELSPDEWDVGALDTWTVRGVVGHLIAIEQYIGAHLGLWPMPPEYVDDADHRLMTESSVAAARDATPAALIRMWKARTAAIVARVAQMTDVELDERVVVHGVSYRWRTLLVARTFEVWTHASDIRAATGRAPVDPEAGRLRLMSEVAVAALPIGLALTGGVADGRSARIVLTGPGGGAWLQPLDLAGSEEAQNTDREPAVTLVVDSVDFCRVAAQRLSPADLDAVIEGDRALALDLLVGVSVFAA